MSTERHDHELAQTLCASARSATEEPYSDQEARRWRIIVSLWERMGQFFGQQWEKSYGTVDDQTIHAWKGALSRFTEEEIAYAVKAIGREFAKGDPKGAKFPPTFPEFRELCQAARQYAKTRKVHAEAETKAVPLADLSRTHKGDSEAAKAEKGRQVNIGKADIGETFEESYHRCGLADRWGPPPKEHSQKGVKP